MTKQIILLGSTKQSKVKKETIDGRECYIVPMTMLNVGTYKGAAGPDVPVYYPKTHLSNSVPRWDGKPITVYHPQKDGKYVPVADIGDISTVGYVRATVMNDNDLDGEAVIDSIKANEVDPRIVELIDLGEPIGLSTGLFVDVVTVDGQVQAHNFDPDHLAILPDKPGACGIKDGCGLLVNEAINPFTANEASFMRVESGIREAMYKKTDSYIYLRDVYQTFFVYSTGDKLWKRGYSVNNDGQVTISDSDAIEVKWVTEYRTVSGNKFVGNCKCKETEMDKKTTIDTILASNCGFEAADRPVLEAKSDASLKLLLDSVKKPATQVNNASPFIPAVAPVAPTTPKQMTLNEYIASAPPELQGPLNDIVVASQAARQQLIANIVANPNNKLTPEYLATLKQEVLQGMAALAATPQTQQQQQTPIFLGQATPGSAPQNNIPTLPVATVSWK